ncbi:MAG: lasso RiPP family leader peptide-containing protein [Alcanivoracaceae bacterium]|nr:lasso RiPP family leader peptide-containing protein [Alcanivoracaceae bacterium]
MYDLNKGNMQQNNKKASKMPYKKPELIPLGDIRDVTMGGSPGFGDSGGGAPEEPF